jgi:NAD(P)-dependent dehydrogenase (short-subunit alcohol dehydrogenase family)
MVDAAVAEYGGVDILHNNAADLRPEIIGVDSQHDLVDLPLELWQRTIAVNLHGQLLGCRYAISEMVKRGGGSIIFTSSTAALNGQRTRVSYGTTKAGVIALSRHVAIEYGKRGIRANVVCPGPTSVPHRPYSDARREMLMRHLLFTRVGAPRTSPRSSPSWLPMRRHTSPAR